jgi:hypothetical protein
LALFRGLANWATFPDRIPHEVLSRITVKNYGFSGAADLLVFISGGGVDGGFRKRQLQRRRLAIQW